MKKRLKMLSMLVLLIIFISGSFTRGACAQNALRKLGRGFANLTTGILELPVSIVDTAEDEGYVAAASYGIVKGVAMSVLRMGVGVYEIATFLIPIPFYYEPILEPEFMLSEDHM